MDENHGADPSPRIGIAAMIDALYHSGCTRQEWLTTYDEEPWRDDPAWVDAIFCAKQPHEPDYAVFKHFCDPASTVLDIGANYGYSVSSMRVVGCRAAIFSVEALPWYRPHLEKVKEREELRFDFCIVGLGERSETLRFVTPVINGTIDGALTSADEAEHRRGLPHNVEAVARGQGVPLERTSLRFMVAQLHVTTLDHLVESYDGPLSFRDVAAIKIDVEGHEPAVLRGAQRITEKHRPLLMIEGANRRPDLVEHSLWARLRLCRCRGGSPYTVRRHF